MTLRPVLSLQTGTLYASNDASWFTGTGGPWGYSPFTGQFGGVVSSAGLAAEPFDDTVYEVSPGDEVTFVLAVQDTTPGAPAYNVRVQSALPTGFVAPPEGMNVTVTDGAGNDLGFTGNLFSGGLQITPPLAGYDADSGGNVALVTYTLQAGPALPGPYATVHDTSSITHVAASPGGGDVSPPTPVSASTTVVTAAPAITAIPETDPSAVAQGQVIAFEVTIPVPAGTLHDLRLDTVLPSGTASLSLVGATVLSTGSQLTLGTPQISGGSVLFGDVSSTGASSTAADAATSASIVVQVQLRADGTASGLATVDAVVSALDMSGTGSRWTADVANSVGVVVTPPAPTLSGLAAQDATSTMTVRPFANLHIADAAPDGVGTLAITLGDGTLGSLVAGAGGTVSGGGTFVVTGGIAALQDAAQHLLFRASGAGTEQFDLTVVDAAGGVAQNNDAMVAVAASVDGTHAVAHNAPLQTTVQVTTAGHVTVAEGEAYTGAVNYLQSQYIYDGAQPATIIAQAPSMYIKNLSANATISVQSGRNVIDAGTGSNLLVGGSGADAFFVDARGGTAAWDTIANFHAGDVATIFGFRSGVSKYSWIDNAGVPGETGRTLRVDLAGNGQTSASLTFAGLDRAASSGFVLSTGQAGGVGYLTVMAR